MVPRSGQRPIHTGRTRCPKPMHRSECDFLAFQVEGFRAFRVLRLLWVKGSRLSRAASS